jgi:hypothetical protein
VTARIQLDRADARHYPGEVVSGTVEWVFPHEPLSASVVLRWRTEGKGSPEQHVESVESFGAPHSTDRRSFRLTLPTMPYSFSGSMLSIQWSVDLVARMPRKRRDTVEAFRIVTMSPTGDPIDPYRR